MTINHLTADHIRFADLKFGDVFIGSDGIDFYMKTEESFEYPDDEYHYCNAVNLKDGSLAKFDDGETVILPKKAYLTVET